MLSDFLDKNLFFVMVKIYLKGKVENVTVILKMTHGNVKIQGKKADIGITKFSDFANKREYSFGAAALQNGLNLESFLKTPVINYSLSGARTFKR